MQSNNQGDVVSISPTEGYPGATTKLAGIMGCYEGGLRVGNECDPTISFPLPDNGLLQPFTNSFSSAGICGVIEMTDFTAMMVS